MGTLFNVRSTVQIQSVFIQGKARISKEREVKSWIFSPGGTSESPGELLNDNNTCAPPWRIWTSLVWLIILIITFKAPQGIHMCHLGRGALD